MTSLDQTANAHCPECGSALVPDQHFCGICGARAPRRTSGLGLSVTGVTLTLLGTLAGGISNKVMSVQADMGWDSSGALAALAGASLVLVAGLLCSAFALASGRGEGRMMSTIALVWGSAVLVLWCASFIWGMLS